MSAKKHLWFCVGEPMDVLRPKRRYRSPALADYQGWSFEESIEPQLMFVYRDDELVWVYDWDVVFDRWCDREKSCPLHTIYYSSSADMFFKQFYEWAVSVWGR